MESYLVWPVWRGKLAMSNMLIIKEPDGTIIAAQVESPDDPVMIPAKPEQTLHRIFDVPDEICNANHLEFLKALSDYINSANPRILLISAEDLLSSDFGKVG
jgi:hypothetical protein